MSSEAGGADDEGAAVAVLPQRGQDANSALLSTATSRYVIHKHSWRGKYLRTFFITPTAVLTVNPSTSECTNVWDLRDILQASPNPKSDEEFSVVVRKGGKQDRSTFSSPLRAHLLTDLLTVKPALAGGEGGWRRYSAQKVKRNGERKQVSLEVRAWALCQVNPITGAAMATYHYRSVERLALVSDLPGGFLVRCSGGSGSAAGDAGGFRRLYMFTCEQREELIAGMVGSAAQCVGVRVALAANADGSSAAVTREQVVQAVRAAEDDSVFNTLAEFAASKHSPARHADPSPRIVTLSDKWLVERNPTNYAVVTMRPLLAVEYVVRSPDDPQALSVHFRDGSESRYSSTSREALLACLLDCIRATGNRDALVLPEPVRRGLRTTPAGVPVAGNVELQMIKALSAQNVADGTAESAHYFALLLATFNANVPYSGPKFVETNRQHKQAIAALGNIVTVALAVTHANKPFWNAALHATRRLVAVRSVFEAFTDSQPIREKLLKLLRDTLVGCVADDVSVCAALDVMSALMVPSFELAEGSTATTDCTNKQFLLDADSLMAALLALFSTHVKRGTSPLAVAGCVEVLTAVLCPPGGDTTEVKYFSAILEQVAKVGRDFFKLFHQGSSLSVVRGAGMIMRAIVEEGGEITTPSPAQKPLPPPPPPKPIPAAPEKSATPEPSKQTPSTEAAVAPVESPRGEQAQPQSPAQQAVPAPAPSPQPQQPAQQPLLAAPPPPPPSKPLLPGIVSRMQLSALAEGATLRHLHAALFSKTATQRQILFKDLSCQLIALWVTGCKEAERMLARVLPPALLYYLESTEEPPPEPLQLSTSASANSGSSAKGGASKFWEQWRKKTYPLRRPAEMRAKNIHAVSRKKNWPMLWYQFRQDHTRADLVWNNHTREELREALEAELRAFRQEQELASDGAFISWNHSEFMVPYDCLRRELNIGGYYIRLLMNPQPGQKAPVLRNPGEFFDMLFHRCLLEREGELQGLCIQVMAVVYKFYHRLIGPFRDVGHLLALLKQCTDKAIRDRLLQLIGVLLAAPAEAIGGVSGEADGDSNVKLFVDYGGVSLLVDLMTVAHLATDHIVTPQQSNLITAGPARAEGEWFYSIVIPGGKKEDGTDLPPKKERVGPKNLVEMKEAVSGGIVSASTLCWAQGMEDWKPLSEIPQLRWSLLATGHPLLGGNELPTLLMDMLMVLCKRYPIRDADGGIIRPIPRPKRQLSGPQLLPHVAQMLLTFDPVLVDRAAQLLEILLEDNAASVPKAYLTGMFMFCCMYAGSNVASLVRLLKKLHLQQHFRGEDDKPPSDISGLSILSPLLPPAMIHLLERRSVEEWCSVLLGNSDTPEAIWNHEMRGLMIDRIATHLGNFPLRLGTNPRAVYQYVPIAPITYKQIEPELFVHHYYLRNLCDLTRFPDWPVDNEVEFLQALLMQWTKEAETAGAARGMGEVEACSVLKLKPGEWSEDELRRAYFRIAKEFHPDKNPEGRSVFQKASEAYTYLSTHQGGDTSKQRISLLVRSQSLLYARFRKELSPFKYAGYPLLLEALKSALEADDREMMHQTTELCFRTIASSGLNAEEMRRQGGLEILAQTLVRLVALIQPDTKTEDTVAQALANVLLTFATAASFEESRTRMAQLPHISRDVCWCLRLAHLPKVVEGALECVCCSALDQNMSRELNRLRVLYLLVPFLFKYDWTLADSDIIDSSAAGINNAETHVTSAAAAATNQQHSRNVQAQLALLSIARLGGLDPACEAVSAVAACVESLLSPQIASLVCNRPATDLLRVLNTNVETPTLIWNAACRAEVLTFIESRMSTAGVATGNADGVDDNDDPETVLSQTFVYKTLQKELQVGGIYLRVFNEQSKSQTTIPDPRGFCLSLIVYLSQEGPALSETAVGAEALQKLRQKAQENLSDSSISEKLAKIDMGLAHIRMAAEALRNLLRANPRGLEKLFCGKEQVRGVVSTLAVAADVGTQLAGLDAVDCLTKSAECLQALAEAGAIGFFAPVLASPNLSVVTHAISTLSSMLGTAKVVADCLSQGALLFLLRVLATPTERGGDPAHRIAAAAAIAKMTADPTHGSRVQIAASKFLPLAFIGSMRQDAESAVHMMDAIHENPELIWTINTRAQLTTTLNTMSTDLYQRLRQDRDAKWGLSDDYKLVYDELKDEPELGGVYLRLFLKQPSWSLRNPKSFVEALLTRYVELYNQAGRDARNAGLQDSIKTVVSASVALFANTPALCDHAAKTGHMAKLFSLMDSSLPKQASAATLVSLLASSLLCVETMATVPAVRALLATMEAVPEQASARVVETLEKAFSKSPCSQEGCLVSQLLACGGVDRLMKVLDGSMDLKLGADGPECKARLVTALQKAMEDSGHGEQLKQVLDQNTTWFNYRGQRHDLFLPGPTSIAGLLTGPGAGAGTTGGAVGLLTNVPHSSQMLSNAPPELPS